MTDTAELERLAASITLGPWGHFMGDICAELHGDDTLICGMNKSCGARSSEYFSYKANNPTAQANADAIALVPDLLAEVIALRAEVARLQARATAAEADADRLAEFVAEFDDGDGSDGCMCRSCRANALIAAHTQRVNEKEGQG